MDELGDWPKGAAPKSVDGFPAVTLDGFINRLSDAMDHIPNEELTASQRQAQLKLFQLARAEHHVALSPGDSWDISLPVGLSLRILLPDHHSSAAVSGPWADHVFVAIWFTDLADYVHFKLKYL